MSRYKQQRRDFIKKTAMVGAGLSTGWSSALQLNSLGRLASQNIAGGDDYKALVCIFFDGGADSFNMVAPKGISEYNQYAISRSNLALKREEILALNATNLTNLSLGLHPMLPKLQSKFNSGKACVISNIGTLVNRITKQDYENGTGKFPLGMFSHSDQFNQWATAQPEQRLLQGWAGRISDLMGDTNQNKDYSMNVSFAGSNIFQSSSKQVEFVVNNSGAITLNGYLDMYNYRQERKAALDSLLSMQYNDPFKQTYAGMFRDAIDNSLSFNKIIKDLPAIKTEFTEESNFGMVAKIIQGRQKLGFKRQIFFINFGGWDTHDNLLEEQNYLFMKIDKQLSDFQDALDELGVSDQVVTFTMSEFGRTLSSNGNGTDHAWGGNVIAMGGPVKGQKVYGTYPSLALDSNLDLGNGVLIPTTPNDLYFAELALWFGVSTNDLHYVFPNLHNFYPTGSTAAPLGFLKI